MALGCVGPLDSYQIRSVGFMFVSKRRCGKKWLLISWSFGEHLWFLVEHREI